MSTEVSNGRRRSKARFHVWTRPRSTLPGSGVTMPAEFGSATRPVLWSGPVMSGMPWSRVPYHMNCCGCVKLEKMVIGYCWSPRSGRAQPIAL